MASGDSLLIFLPANNEPPATLFATVDTRNSHTILNFDDTLVERAVFKGVMPQHYGGSGVTVHLHYLMASVVSGDIDWDVEFERVSPSIQDIDADGFGPVNSTDGTTVPGTSGLVAIVPVVCSAGANMDSVVAGDGFRIRVTRPNTGSATSDASLWAIELRET